MFFINACTVLGYKEGPRLQEFFRQGVAEVVNTAGPKFTNPGAHLLALPFGRKWILDEIQASSNTTWVQSYPVSTLLPLGIFISGSVVGRGARLPLHVPFEKS